MQYFKNKVLLGQGRCETTNMQATGIPDHLCIVEKMNKLETEVRLLRTELHQEQTDTRNVVLGAVSDLPLQLKTVIMENFIVEGTTPISAQDIVRIMLPMEERLMSRLTLLSQGHVATNRVDQVNAQTAIVRRPHTEFPAYFWGDKVRMCPEGFEFPTFDVATMFNLWHFGNSEIGIQPYKYFGNHRDDLREKKHKNNFDRARLVMTEIDNILNNNQLLGDYENVSQMNSITEQHNAFNAAYVKLLEICYEGPKRRPNDITLSTIASKLYEHYKKQRVN